MKLKIFIIIIIGLLIVPMISLIYYFNSGKNVSINEDIPDKKISAKDLVELAKPYVDKYFQEKDYYIGEINMDLDKNLEGVVQIWYKEKQQNHKKVPNIVTIEIDTKNKRILSIIDQVDDSKIEPGIINIEEWSIDSSDAIELAKKIYKNYNDFDFTTVYLSGTQILENGPEKWKIGFFNQDTLKAFTIDIDPYTGKVYDFEYMDIKVNPNDTTNNKEPISSTTDIPQNTQLTKTPQSDTTAIPTTKPEATKAENFYIEEVISNYETLLVEAINNNDFSLIESLLVPNSNLYNSQKKLVSDLYTKNIKEKLIDFNIESIENTGKNGIYKVYVSESIGIKYLDKQDFETKKYDWIYTVVKSKDSIGLSEIEKWNK